MFFLYSGFWGSGFQGYIRVEGCRVIGGWPAYRISEHVLGLRVRDL